MCFNVPSYVSYFSHLFLHCRSAGLDSSWLNTWSSQGVDGAGPSTAMRPVGLSRVQMMMRHLASVGETYAQTAMEDTAWSLWPMNPSQAAAAAAAAPSGSPIPPIPGRYPTNAGGLRTRPASRAVNDNVANLLAMAETVREVLPHIPDELIFQVQFGSHTLQFADIYLVEAINIIAIVDLFCVGKFRWCLIYLYYNCHYS